MNGNPGDVGCPGEASKFRINAKFIYFLLYFSIHIFFNIYQYIICIKNF